MISRSRYLLRKRPILTTFKAGDTFVLLNPWLNKLEKKKDPKQGKVDAEVKWMAKRYLNGHLPADPSFYSTAVDDLTVRPLTGGVE